MQCNSPALHTMGLCGCASLSQSTRDTIASYIAGVTGRTESDVAAMVAEADAKLSAARLALGDEKLAQLHAAEDAGAVPADPYLVELLRPRDPRREAVINGLLAEREIADEQARAAFAEAQTLRVALQTDRAVIYHGDCSLIESVLPPNSIDAVVEDPPAGISFMAKSWDDDKGGRDEWIAWLAERMRIAFRLLKPGGYALVWALPRTSHWTATAIENAGFEIRDIVMHLFGTGFPKSTNVSLEVDKRLSFEPLERLQGAIKAARERLGITQSEAARRCGLVPPDGKLEGGGYMWYETGRRIPTREIWPGLKTSLQLGDEFDALFIAAERAVVGSMIAPDATQVRPGFAGATYSGDAAGATRELEITTALSENGRRWEGWGTALKPACEHWILARKPLEKTIARNVLKYGTGGLNIDACRIEGRDRTDYGLENAQRTQGVTYGAPSQSADFDSQLGRWPAHLVLDEDAAADLDAQTGERRSAGHYPSDAARKGGSTDFAMSKQGTLYADNGGASRYFYVTKASRSEKDDGLDHLPIKSGGEATDRKDGSAGLKNPRAGAGRTGGARNFHPTVKSIALMRWLCRLITPPNGVILDMFAGSGSTLVAGLEEGFRVIGCELNAEYVPILVGRVQHALAKPRE